MSRVFEAYHDEARRASGAKTDERQPESIHDRMVLKEAGLIDILTYDRNPRYSFMDHLFRGAVTVDDLIAGRYDEAGDFVTGEYTVSEASGTPDGITIELIREGSIAVDSKRVCLGIKKRYTIQNGSPSVTVGYTLFNRGLEACSFFFWDREQLYVAGGRRPRTLPAAARRYATPDESARGRRGHRRLFDCR